MGRGEPVDGGGRRVEIGREVEEGGAGGAERPGGAGIEVGDLGGVDVDAQEPAAGADAGRGEDRLGQALLGQLVDRARVARDRLGGGAGAVVGDEAGRADGREALARQHPAIGRLLGCRQCRQGQERIIGRRAGQQLAIVRRRGRQQLEQRTQLDPDPASAIFHTHPAAIEQA